MFDSLPYNLIYCLNVIGFLILLSSLNNRIPNINCFSALAYYIVVSLMLSAFNVIFTVGIIWISSYKRTMPRCVEWMFIKLKTCCLKNKVHPLEIEPAMQLTLEKMKILVMSKIMNEAGEAKELSQRSMFNSPVKLNDMATLIALNEMQPQQKGLINDGVAEVGTSSCDHGELAPMGNTANRGQISYSLEGRSRSSSTQGDVSLADQPRRENRNKNSESHKKDGQKEIDNIYLQYLAAVKLGKDLEKGDAEPSPLMQEFVHFINRIVGLILLLINVGFGIYIALSMGGIISDS